MKTTSKKMAAIATAAATAALCVTMASNFKAEEQGYGALPRTDQPNQPKPETSTTDAQPARFNKATGIIGMDVRNHMDERLGEIREVVFDLPSERVAYAVLNTGGIMGRGKLLAVPLSAFTVGADQKFLILRAEKTKVEAAQGLQRDNWPNVSTPSWGAQPFWENESAKQPGNDNPPRKQESKPEDK